MFKVVTVCDVTACPESPLTLTVTHLQFGPRTASSKGYDPSFSWKEKIVCSDVGAVSSMGVIHSSNVHELEFGISLSSFRYK